MEYSQAKQHRKSIFSTILILAVISVLLFSSFFISGHIRHECTGEDCSICADLRVAEGFVSQIGGAFAIEGAVIAILYTAIYILLSSSIFLQRETLISQKVRLND